MQALTGSIALARPEFGLRKIYLLPGNIHVAAKPTVVTTVLGSCIAVCMWDKVRRVGGMNHFVLPDDRCGDRSSRYGNAAVDELMAGLIGLGCRVQNLRAKVLGGADVLPVRTSAVTTGARNQQMALGRLRHHGIPGVAQRTGGRSGMLIRMFTESGEVMVRRVTGTSQRA